MSRQKYKQGDERGRGDEEYDMMFLECPVNDPGCQKLDRQKGWV
jgi:hypothetical protein